MGRFKGYSIKGSCPTCGATPCHQKWKRSTKTYHADMDLASNMNPVDGFICPRCYEAFRVSRLESEDGFIIDWKNEFECNPNYCPNCGYDLKGDGDER